MMKMTSGHVTRAHFFPLKNHNFQKAESTSIFPSETQRRIIRGSQWRRSGKFVRGGCRGRRFLGFLRVHCQVLPHWWVLWSKWHASWLVRANSAVDDVDKCNSAIQLLFLFVRVVLQNCHSGEWENVFARWLGVPLLIYATDVRDRKNNSMLLH